MNANLKIWLLIFGSIIVFTSPSTAAVTLDEIHNSVMALVRSYALLDNKLERHEQRERLLGEILKKSLVTLQRGQREFDSMKGSFERLEQRVSEVESFLINKDESNRVQQKTIAEAIASIHDWMVKNKKDSEDKAASCFSSSSDEDEDVSKKIDDLNANIGQLRKEVAEIKEKSQNNEAKVQKLFVDTMDIFEAKTNSASIQLTKIDEKLEGYISGTATTAAPPHNSEWETQVQTSLGEIITTLNTVKEPTPIVFDRSFFEEIGNETKASIERSKTQILESSDKNFAKTASRIKELSETFSSSMSELSSKIGKVSDRPVIVQSNSDGGVNMDSLKSELAVLEHFNVSLQQTSENVLNIKNRLEFQIHQIVLEVTDSVNENIKELNTNMNKKFTNIDSTILENQSELVANLSTKVETEIGQVWRQVGMMFQEITLTKTNLEKVLQYSESYVNSTTISINGVEATVAGIAARVEDMYTDVNYLLGRLSLVNHEFNELKTGLGLAIDNLKGSLKLVKEKINIGPGPHKIQNDGSS